MGRLEQVIADFLEIRGSELVLCFVGVGIRDHVALAEQRNEERLALPRPEGRGNAYGPAVRRLDLNILKGRSPHPKSGPLSVQ